MRKATFCFVFILISPIILGYFNFESKMCFAWPSQNMLKTYYYSLQEAPVDLERPYLLIFFNVACHVCWDELFIWQEFVSRRQIPVQLVGVTADQEEAAVAFLNKYPLSFPIIIDRRRHLFRLYQVKMEPYLLLGRGQEIIYKDNLMEPIGRRREKLEQCLLAIR